MTDHNESDNQDQLIEEDVIRDIESESGLISSDDYGEEHQWEE